MEPSDTEAWGWGTKTRLGRSTLKSVSTVYYYIINEKWIKTKTGQFQAELRRAAQSWVTLPWRSSSELSDTDKSFRY